jgi:uncharacterized membrane protein YfcA
MDLSTQQQLLVALVGLGAGLAGGLAGVGGSIIMIPCMALVIGFSTPDKPEQHLFQAAAMCVNVVVALMAARTHLRKKTIRLDLFRVMLPAMAVAMIAGVLLSNVLSGAMLTKVLAGVLAWDALVNIWRLIRKVPETPREQQRTGPVVIGSIGAFAGLAGGLAGLGGGALMTPLLNMLSKIPLREAISTSAGVMGFTSLIGAGLKVSTLSGEGFRAADAFLLAVLMTPGALLGSWLGSKLMHTLPNQYLRLVISAVMLTLAAKLAGLF